MVLAHMNKDIRPTAVQGILILAIHQHLTYSDGSVRCYLKPNRPLLCIQSWMPCVISITLMIIIDCWSHMPGPPGADNNWLATVACLYCTRQQWMCHQPNSLCPG